MQSGTVKFFDVTKGFGFIKADDGSIDVFVHKTALEKSGIDVIEAGQKVEFVTQQRGAKISVASLRLIAKSNQSFAEKAAEYIASKENSSVIFAGRIRDLKESLKSGRRFSWGRGGSLLELLGPFVEGSKVVARAAVTQVNNADYYPADWYFNRGEIGCDTETGRYFYWYGFDGDFDPKRSFYRRNKMVWSRDIENLKMRFYAAFVEDSREL